MDNRGRRKEKIRFRNTIDPEFTRLRRSLNWLKPAGVVEILHGCILMASAVTIILSFKRTFLEGQSYSSRITPNFVIGITSLAAGIRAVCIKSAVGFSLDKPALKCVIGFCAVSTFVSLSMSVLLICLSAYEYHTLIYNPPDYSFIGDRIALNLMNLVVSCLSTIVCIGVLIVYVRVAIRIPMVKHHSPTSAPHAQSSISVISNGSIVPRVTSDPDVPETYIVGTNSRGYANGSYVPRESPHSYVNGSFASKESLPNDYGLSNHKPGNARNVNPDNTHRGNRVPPSSTPRNPDENTRNYNRVNTHQTHHVPPFGVSQYANTNKSRRNISLTDDNWSIGSSDTSIPTNRGILGGNIHLARYPKNGSVRQTGARMNGNSRNFGSVDIGNRRQSETSSNKTARLNGSPIIINTRRNGSPAMSNVRRNGAPITGNVRRNGAQIMGNAVSTGPPIVIGKSSRNGPRPLNVENPVLVHVRNLSRSPVNLNMKIREVDRVNIQSNTESRGMGKPSTSNSGKYQNRDTLLTIASQHTDRPHGGAQPNRSGYANGGYDSGIDNQNINEWRGTGSYGVKLDRSPIFKRNSEV